MIHVKTFRGTGKTLDEAVSDAEGKANQFLTILAVHQVVRLYPQSTHERQHHPYMEENYPVITVVYST